MNHVPWDWLLAAFTVGVLYLTGNKSIWAPIGGIANNVMWILYSYFTHQYGIAVGSVVMGAMYVRALILWRRDERRIK